MASEATSLISALGHVVGLDRLALDSDGALTLQVGDHAKLHFQHDPIVDWFTLFVPLGTVPLEGRSQLLSEMLRANLFWQATLGATLSLDDQEPPRAVVAMRLPCASTTPAAFVEEVEHLLKVAHDWTGTLASGNGIHIDATQLPINSWGIRA